jgi:hypothetical protein
MQDPIRKITRAKRAGGMAQVVGHPELKLQYILKNKTNKQKIPTNP